MPALIFDCDGVLAETERDGHLPAFNHVFAELGVPLHWTEAVYADRLRIGGGKERVRASLTPDLLAAAGVNPDELDAWVSRLHARKTEIFTEIVSKGDLKARPGVLRLVDEAREAGWALAVASTSSETSVRAILDHAIGRNRASEFSVFAGDVVPRKKPDGAIYELALGEMAVKPEECVAIEDSRNGLLAAVAAGIRCVVTVSHFTQGERFDEAALIVGNLNDAAGPVTLSDLERLLEVRPRSGEG